MENVVSSFVHTADVLVTSSEKAETPIGHFQRPPATLTVSCDGHKGSGTVQRRQKAPLCCPAPRSPFPSCVEPDTTTPPPQRWPPSLALRVSTPTAIPTAPSDARPLLWGQLRTQARDIMRVKHWAV
ncbi:hypothetical protein CDEST_01642 [Colletotrichum destructivum]|uniref:Uncharacterized protein n=1 Tax=Colletotrichum destructivum TaxID=34406 RepID=A0AAX4I0U4_9PEZI|nr:hypothetical protein CDEST_01642 [Colletotrichum destructivum]